MGDLRIMLQEVLMTIEVLLEEESEDLGSKRSVVDNFRMATEDLLDAGEVVEEIDFWLTIAREGF